MANTEEKDYTKDIQAVAWVMFGVVTQIIENYDAVDLMKFISREKEFPEFMGDMDDAEEMMYSITNVYNVSYERVEMDVMLTLTSYMPHVPKIALDDSETTKVVH